MRRSFARRVLSARRPDSHDPLDLVVDLAMPDWWGADHPTAGTTLRELLAFSYSEESIRETDPAVSRWALDLATRVRVAAAHRADTQTDWLHYILQTPEPIGSFPAPGFADVRDWDAVVSSDAWRGLVVREGRGDVSVPTTLGRIDSGRARALLARGYLNTFLASLYIAPLGPHDLDRLGTLTRRLDAIVPPVRRRGRRLRIRAG